VCALGRKLSGHKRVKPAITLGAIAGSKVRVEHQNFIKGPLQLLYCAILKIKQFEGALD